MSGPDHPANPRRTPETAEELGPKVHNTTATPPPAWLHKAVKRAIKTLVQATVALACIFFASPEATNKSLAALRSFTPVTMSNLIADAMSDCEHRSSIEPYPTYAQLDMPKITTSDLLRPSSCRVSPLENGWPTVGNWVAGLEKLGVPRMPIISPMVALAGCHGSSGVCAVHFRCRDVSRIDASGVRFWDCGRNRGEDQQVAW